MVAKTLRCGGVSEKYVLNEIIIEDLGASICQSVREYWKDEHEANFHDPALYVTSLLLLL